MIEAPTLVELPLSTILTFWRPGSQDWSWQEEFTDLMTRHRDVTDGVWKRVNEDGFGFVDDISPILLGTDGRVWDGHHRICIAIETGQHKLMVELA